MLIDEIEREIAERYMELPVDAGGLPIHVGDYLQLGDTRGKVVALNYCPSNGTLPWEWQCDTGDWYNTAFACHYNPRTVEDVLTDYWREACELPVDMSDESTAEAIDKLVVKYRAEICELRQTEVDR